MDDMQDYKKTLKALDYTGPVATILNRLGEVAIDTEDDYLIKNLSIFASSIRERFSRPTEKVRLLSIPHEHALIGHIGKNADTLAKYCQHHINSGEKQWQILARQAGWTPPAVKAKK